MPDPNATAPMPPVGMSGSIIEVLGWLMALVAIIYLAYYLLKRFGGRFGFKIPERAGLSLVGQLPLGPKRGVAVVRFMDKLLVLGVTDHSINLLHTFDRNDKGHEKDFSKVLEKHSDTSGAS